MRKDNKIYDIAYNYLKTFETNDDLIQEVLLSLFLKIDKYDEKRGSIKAFISEIHKSKKIDMWRRNKEKNTDLFSSFDVETNDGISNKLNNLQNETLDDDDNLKKIELLSSKINDLNQIKKEVIELYIDGYKLFEIAKKLNKKYTTIRAMFKRIKKELKKPKKIYFLINIKTGKIKEFENAYKVADYIGCTSQTVLDSIKLNKKICKKKWKVKRK